MPHLKVLKLNKCQGRYIEEIRYSAYVEINIEKKLSNTSKSLKKIN